MKYADPDYYPHGHLEELLKSLDTIPEYTKLKNEWETATQGVPDIPHMNNLRVGRPHYLHYHERPLLAFSMLVKLGINPPPELLLWVLLGYEEYLEHGGEVDIEDIYFEKPERGKLGGIFAHRYERDKDLQYLFSQLEDFHYVHPDVEDLKEACQLICPEKNDDEIETLLRRLRGLKLNQSNWISTFHPLG